MLLRALVLLALSASAQPYTWGSLPRKLQAIVPRPQGDDELLFVEKRPDDGTTLWQIGLGCAAESCRRMELVREDEGAFTRIGLGYRDPLNGGFVTAFALVKLAREDAAARRWVAAAGRLGLRCAAGCDPKLRALEGTSALAAGLFPQAERAFRAVLAKSPANGAARLALGDALWGEKKKALAREAYEEAARDPDSKVKTEAKARLAALPR